MISKLVLPEQGQEMHEHTPWPQPLTPAPPPQTPEPRPRQQTRDTHPLSGLENLGLVMTQKLHLAVQSLQEAEAARTTSNVDVDQQLLSESAGCDSLRNVPLPATTPPTVPLPEAHSAV
jgi:hypothetical protein